MGTNVNAAGWLTEHVELLPHGGDALDVACGRGRQAFWLAAHGFRVQGMDRDPAAVAFVNDEARLRRLSIRADVVDLETGHPPIGEATFDLIVVIHYLHRPLVSSLVGGLRPGGVLVYETFTRAQAARGKPTNPAYLLESGELGALVAPLDVVLEREGDYDGRSIASVIASKRF